MHLYCLVGTMGGWRKWLEEESEYQWLSFAGFAIFVILGSIYINASSDLAGVNSGTLHENGTGDRLLEVTDSMSLWESDTGRYVLDGSEKIENYQFSSCISESATIKLICPGTNGIVYVEKGNGWSEVSVTDTNHFATHASMGDGSSLVVLSNGIESSFLAYDFETNTKLSNIAEYDGESVIINSVMSKGENRWLAGGKILLSIGNEANPPSREAVFDIIYNVQNQLLIINPLHIDYSNDGEIHSIIALGDGAFFAAGTNKAIMFGANEHTKFEHSSRVVIEDLNGDIWLYGTTGDDFVVRISEGEVYVESLSEPLRFLPEIGFLDDGKIVLHGVSDDGSHEALNIDVDARGSLTSLRGIFDFMFIISSLLVIGLMTWNVGDAISKGEIF